MELIAEELRQHQQSRARLLQQQQQMIIAMVKCLCLKTIFFCFKLAYGCNGRIGPFKIFLVHFFALKVCPWDWVRNVGSWLHST